MLHGKKRKHRKKLFRIFLFFAGFFALLWGISSWITPVLTDRLSYQARILVTAAINQTVAEQLEQMDVSYQQIIHLTRDGSGKITSLQVDSVLLNQIKSAVTQKVAERIQSLSATSLRIPLGSLTGFKILSGRGPDIQFRLLPEGVVQTDLYHQFSAAGVNQTLHLIYLQIETDVSAVIPGFSMKTSISTNMELGQTVILGEVPEFFGSIGLGNSTTAQ